VSDGLVATAAYIAILGLRDGDAEFQQLTVDAWCSPKKIRVSHLADQLARLKGDPRALTSPATT
jgi:hypothetical protein